MGKPIATKIYDIYGRFYGIFEGLFRRRLAKALAAVPFHAGDRVLDIGAGTGLALEFFPDHVQVVGIDLSAGMLRQGQRKLDAGLVRASCHPHATQLIQTDALHLPFADKSFQVVLLSHVISTVPDPARCLAEALRVAADQAVIILVNHFRSPWPVINWVETAIDPICRKLGWRCDLCVEQLLEGAVESGGRRVGRGLIFRIVYLQKRREGVRLVDFGPAVKGKRKAALGMGKL